jgi:carbohydrate kinase (thermoresistant glucokinase family)
MESGIPLDDGDRVSWISRINEGMRQVLRQRSDAICIVACSALKERYREWLCHGLSQPCLWIVLDGAKEVLKARLEARRGHFMNPALLDSQLDILERPDAASRGVLLLDVAMDRSEQLEKATAWIQTHFILK